MATLSSLYTQYAPTAVDPSLDAQFVFFPVTADMNGDGKQDLLVLGANYPGGSITNTGQPGRLLFGDGNGGFTVAAESVFPISTLLTVHPRKVLFGDLNGDNRLDVFISSHGWDTNPFPGEQNRLYLSDSEGGWYDATATLPQLSDFSHTSAIGDINHDGDLDIFVGNGYAGQNHIFSYVLNNNGLGTFTQSRAEIPGSGSILDFEGFPHHFPGATLADLNGDSLPELIITADSSASYDQNKNSAILWNHSGVFSQSDMTLLPVPAEITTQIALDAKPIDINGDGLLDLVVAGTQGQAFYDGWFVQILLNEGNKHFVDMTTTYLAPADSWGGVHGDVANEPWPAWVTVLDFNHDDFPDFSLEYSSVKPSTPLVWINDGTGHFSTLKTSDFVDAGQEYLLGGGHLYETANGYSFVNTQQWGGELKVMGLVASAPYTNTIASSGSALLFGDIGNDTLAGGTGNDTINGGAGTDTAIYAGIRNNYTVTRILGGYTVADNAGTDGTDTVFKIEKLQFGDQFILLALSIDGTSGNDRLTGTSEAEVVYGYQGNDKLIAAAGDDTLDGGPGQDTLDGGVGNDTYIVDHSGDRITEKKNEGSDTIESSVSYSLADTDGTGTLGGNVENLTLTGSAISATGNGLANTLTGNSESNTLSGAAGNDTLLGGDGNDVLNGGDGVDSMDGGTGDDIYLIASSSQHTQAEIQDSTGTDEIRFTSTTANATLVLYAEDTGLEKVSITSSAGLTTGTTALNINASAAANALTLTGNNGNNKLTGTAYADTLVGNGGNDALDGGLGADSMVGGLGSDTYTVDDAGDSIAELNNEGTDTVISSISYSLGADIENLTLSGTGNINASGNGGNNNLRGNTGDNLMQGGEGNDSLKGDAGADTLDGGLGRDTLIGGTGDDTYYVTLAVSGPAGYDRVFIQDSVVESKNAGSDTLVLSGATTSYTVPSVTLGSNIENLDASMVSTISLTSSRGISLYGNTLNNRITGNGDANYLAGGAGNDTLDGGAGEDELNGGSGSDVLIGGEGSDRYILSNDEDTIYETGSYGADTIIASFSIDLNHYVGIEDVLLNKRGNFFIIGDAHDNALVGDTGNETIDGGAGNDYLFGNPGNDRLNGGDGNDDLIGFTGNDILDGGSGNDYLIGDDAPGSVYDPPLGVVLGNDTLSGGLGNDTLTGRGGKDVFLFNTTPNADANLDTITDFNVVDDTIGLDNAVFTGFATEGGLGAGVFALSTSTKTANTRIIYDADNGSLYYDTDGEGGADAVQFATLTGHPTLTSADFVVM